MERSEAALSYDVFVKAITSGLSQIRIMDLIDILIIAVIIYKLIVLTKETRAYQVLKGMGILFICAVVCSAPNTNAELAFKLVCYKRNNRSRCFVPTGAKARA